MANMNDTTIEMIEPTPKLETRQCRLYAWILGWLLRSATLLCGLIFWYRYDYFYGAIALLVTYVVMGIVRSKLRNSVIPLAQQEYAYSDQAIATWYVAKRLCNTL